MSLQSPFYFSLRVKLHLIISPLPSSPLYVCLRNSLSQNLHNLTNLSGSQCFILSDSCLTPASNDPNPSSEWYRASGESCYMFAICFYTMEMWFFCLHYPRKPVSLRPCPWDPETQKAHTKHSKNKVKQCKVLGDWNSSKFKKSRRLKCSWFYEIYSCFFYSLHSHKSLRSLKT